MENSVSSLYVHFPFCRHLCNYCDFYKIKKIPDKRDVDSFIQSLKIGHRKNQKMLEDFSMNLSALESLYIGGGTPSLFGPNGAKGLFDFFKEFHIELSESCEFTIEANPDSLTKEFLDSWRQIGVNRVSLGIQCLNEKLFPYLDRVHDLGESLKALELLKEENINFSVDLMLGLPRTDFCKRDLFAEIEDLTSYGPAHFSVYILTVGEGYKFFNDLPSEETIESEYLRVCEILSQKGYYQYEVSNFSKPGKESFHNSRYWRSESVLALGPSATGFIKRNEGPGFRYKWKASSVELVHEELNANELALEKFYLLLRTNFGLQISDFFSGEDCEKVSGIIESWDKGGFVHSKAPLILNPRGFLIMDSLVGEILPIISNG